MRRAARRIVGDVLLTSAAGRRLDAELADALAGLRAPEVDALLLAASRHGVTGMLGAAVEEDRTLPASVVEPVRMARRRAVRDHLRAVGELAVLGQRLDASAVPWLLCKGPALATVAYPQPHLREYTDLDVLVPMTHVPEALAALGSAGFALAGPDLRERQRHGAGEIRLRSPAGLPIDLHWDLVNDPAARSAFDVAPTADLLSSARTLNVHGTSFLTLDPVDTLLHVALHACTSGGWRLLWLRDVLQAARAVQPSTDEVLPRSRRWGVELVLASMLDRAQRVLRTPVQVDAGCPGPSWLRLLAVVDGVSPVQQGTGRPSLTRITTKSTRRDSPSSVAELLRRSGGFARDALLRPRG